MSYPGEIFLPRGTRLICPKCGELVAQVVVDIISRGEFDFRAIEHFDYPRDQAVWGVSPCCLERYVTFDGLFYTEFGIV